MLFRPALTRREPVIQRRRFLRGDMGWTSELLYP